MTSGLVSVLSSTLCVDPSSSAFAHVKVSSAASCSCSLCNVLCDAAQWLAYLYLVRTAGSIPPELGKLVKLDKLSLAGNKLTGKFLRYAKPDTASYYMIAGIDEGALTAQVDCVRGG